MIRHGYEIEKAKIPEYLNDAESLAAIVFYNRYKVFGFPYDGGWAEQPAIYVDIITLLETETVKRMRNKI